jgi:hypothetical protein
MVKQAGGTLFTEDFLDRSDLPQFRRILSCRHKAVLSFHFNLNEETV